MHARICLGWLLALIATTPGGVTRAAPADAFLDQPIPPGYVPHISGNELHSDPKENYGAGWLGYNSYQERLDALKKLAPRRLVLPEGFADFIAKVDERSHWDKGDTLFSNEEDGVAGYGTTYRAFMTESFLTMGLDCKYDAATDALVTDFPWHHDDPRSNHDLLQVLTTTQPVAEDLTHPHPADPWRTALDALLSKPDNFASAWKLRFLDDVREEFFYTPQSGTILWSGELPDEKTKKHFLIINYHSGMMPEGTFCCYVFDSEGRFEYGALLDGAYRCGDIPHVDLQPSGKGLTIYYTDPNRPACGYLYLEREGVMLHDSDVRNGSYLGLPLYRTETILN